MVEKAKPKKQDDTNSGVLRGYDVHMYPQRANIPLQSLDSQICTDSGSHIRSPLHAKLQPSIGAISPVVDLHGQRKALWKSRHVKMSGSESRGQEEAARTRIPGLRDHYSELFTRIVGLNF